MAKALRVSFKSGYAAVDELEIFGKPSEDLNLARNSRGTKVRTDPSFSQQGNRFPIDRVIDGKYGTQRWQASYNKKLKMQPWLEITFKEPVLVGRMRMSSNREYYYETDYLEQKNKFNFQNYVVEGQLPDGSWKEIASTPKIKKGVEQNKVLSDAVREISHLSQHSRIFPALCLYQVRRAL